MTTDSFPPDIQQFVRQQISSGNYRSEEELMVEAIRFFRESNIGLQQLKEGLNRRIERLDRDEGIDLEDDEALGLFLDQVEAEVQGELEAEKKSRP